MFAVGGPKVAEIYASIDGGMRFLNMENSPQANARMQAVRREYHVAPVQPAPNYPGVLGPTNLMEYHIVMLTHKDTAADLVYKVVKTAHANKPALVAGRAGPYALPHCARRGA